MILTLYTMELYSILKIKPSFKGTVEDVSPQKTGWVQCALSCCLTVQQLARVSAAPSLTTHHLTTALVTIGNSDQDPTPPPLSSQHYKVSCRHTETGTNQDARHISELRLLNCFWFCILIPLMKVLLYSTTITKVSSWSLHVFVWIEYDRSFIQWIF